MAPLPGILHIGPLIPKIPNIVNNHSNYGRGMAQASLIRLDINLISSFTKLTN